MIVLSFIAGERRAHPILWRMLDLSACAALGTALPDIIAIVGRVL